MTKNNSSFKLSFKNRERDLEALKRFHKNKVMFYRTNLLIHSKRVEATVVRLSPAIVLLYPEFDVELARVLAKHHDDYELIPELGDIPGSSKIAMNRKQLKKLEKKELRAIEAITQMYPKKVQGYVYKDLLLHAVYKDCIEAQFVSFIDKVEAYCESLHETLAGNTVFVEPIINYWLRNFSNLSKNFPLIKKAFRKGFCKKHPFFGFSVVDFTGYFSHGSRPSRLHTPKTILQNTSIQQYELWKTITLVTFPDGLEMLTKQIEFHKKKKQKS